MKNLIIIAFLLLSSIIFAQQNNPKGFDCVMPSGANTQSAPDLVGGLHKPESIGRYTTEQDAYFPVLIVYVQFQNDPGADVPWWPRDINEVPQPPSFLGDVIATTKATGYGDEWWNAYNDNTATLSDYWMEVSRGEFHLVGQEVHVVLPYRVSWYDQYSNGLERSMEDLFIALQNNPNIYWPDYDKWSKDSYGDFQYNQPDGFVDMMYIVARSNPCSPYSPSWGYFRPSGIRGDCTHYGDHTLYTNGLVTVKTRGSLDMTGSGFTISPGGCGNGVMYAPMDKWATISFTGHEHGHYFFGDGYFFEFHQQYSKVNNYHGMEEYLSPYEIMRLGYQTPQEVNYAFTSDYSINDFVSFGPNSQLLKVPIGNSSRNEFFILANRQHLSKYDKLMWGDTAHDNPYREFQGNALNYGKGVYIYHAYPGQVGQGYPFGINIDIEAADGLFNWVQNGYQHPDWSCTQNVEYYVRNNVVYNLNDNGGEMYQQNNNHDGLSMYTWLGLGKKENPPCQYGDGTDRIYTTYIADEPIIYPNPNPYEVWTSREWKGDRWDAWKVGYNEVFSPYSSPSTRDWDNNNTGIFIYLYNQHSTQADLKIYKAGDGLTEDQILQLTPPSRPMNLKVEHCYQTTPSSYFYNKLTWNHNLEPDMRRDMGLGMYTKRYKVYKTISANMTLLPDENNYTLLATIDIDENQTPVYIDVSEPSGCNGPPDASCPPVCWILHPVRYRVEAVDIYETRSVKSDFASALAYNTSTGGGIEEGDTPPRFVNLAPTEFALLQNYPNPFNPSTEIKYDLPKSSFVTIKVYDTKGAEVAVLINNEYKEAGRYNAIFNGSNLASGIYFYTIEAGSFSATRKMVLIK